MADALDNHAKLAELAIRRFDTRRAYEWKILLGFWAAMLAVFSPAWSIYKPHPAIVVVAVITFVMSWLSGVWIANYNDKARYEYHFQIAEQLAGRHFAAPEYPQQRHRLDLIRREMWKPFCSDWNVQFQVIGTLVIAALLVTSQSEIKPKVEGGRIRSIGSLEHANERTRSFGWLDLQQSKE